MRAFTLCTAARGAHYGGGRSGAFLSSNHSLVISQREFSPPFFFSRKKVIAQLAALKHEAENARKIAREDVEKAKLYGITAFGKDILEVVDTLEKGMHAFESHQAKLRGGNEGGGLGSESGSADDIIDKAPQRTTSATGSEDGPRTSSDGGPSVLSSSSSSSSSSAAAAVAHQKSLESIYTGVKLSTKMLHKHLSKHGIEKIPAQQGDRFDPQIHDALTSVPASPSCPPDTIAAVLKDGYTIRGRVLRAAQVSVAMAETVVQDSASAEENSSEEKLEQKGENREN